MLCLSAENNFSFDFIAGSICGTRKEIQYGNYGKCFPLVLSLEIIGICELAFR